MNYYAFHVGDYMTATAHLTWLEDAAYRRLLDLYYSREEAIPVDVVKACRLARAVSQEERAAVALVLSEFFTETETGWTHGRCEEEISKAKDAADRARKNGSKGGRPKEPRPNPEETQPVISGLARKTQGLAPNPNPNPNPNDSVSKDTADKSALSDKDKIYAYGLPMLLKTGIPERQARSFLGRLCKDHNDAVVVATLRDCYKAQPIQPIEWLMKALPLPVSATVPAASDAGAALQKIIADTALTKPPSDETRARLEALKRQPTGTNQ